MDRTTTFTTARHRRTRSARFTCSMSYGKTGPLASRTGPSAHPRRGLQLQRRLRAWNDSGDVWILAGHVIRPLGPLLLSLLAAGGLLLLVLRSSLLLLSLG